MKAIKISLVLFIIIVGSLAVARKAECQETGEGQITHTVKPGDSLTKLSKEYGVTAQEIVAANPQSKFTKVCIDEKEHTTRTGREITLCRRVGYWLKVGRTIVIPTSSETLGKKVAELAAEKEALEKEREELRTKNEELLSQLVLEKEKYEKLQNQKYLASLEKFENSIVQRVWQRNLILVLFPLAFLALLTILIMRMRLFRKDKIRVADRNESESVKKAREDLICDRRAFLEEQEAAGQRLVEIKKELDEREKKISQQEKALHEAELNLEKKQKESAGKPEEKEDLNQMREMVERKELELLARQDEIEKHETDLAERETKLQEEERENATGMLNLSARQKSLAEREVILKKKEEELEKRLKFVEQREQELREREAKLIEIYKKLHGKEEALGEKERLLERRLEQTPAAGIKITVNMGSPSKNKEDEEDDGPEEATSEIQINKGKGEVGGKNPTSVDLESALIPGKRGSEDERPTQENLVDHVPADSSKELSVLCQECGTKVRLDKLDEHMRSLHSGTGSDQRRN